MTSRRFARGGVLAQCGIEPSFATEVGLSSTAAATPPRPVAATPVTEANGELVLTAIRTAAEKRLYGRVRKLCAWFTEAALRTVEVHDLLDALRVERAEQIAGLRPGRGRRPLCSEDMGLITTIDRLVLEKKISVARAAAVLASIPGVMVTARHLANVHVELGPLAKALVNGYWIPAGVLLDRRWDHRDDDVMLIYVR